MKSFLLALLLLQLTTQQTAPPPAGDASIEGVVLLAGTSKPVANAVVRITGTLSNIPPPTEAQRTVTTGADGRFAFRNLAPASPYYRLAAERKDYSGDALVQVPLQAGQAATDIVLSLTTGGNISGRVLDPSGRPLAGVLLYVYRDVYPEGLRSWSTYNVAVDGSRLVSVGRTSLRAGSSVGGGGAVGTGGLSTVTVNVSRTDANGNYSLRLFPPGLYYVGVEYSPALGAPVPFDGIPNGFAPTYYPGVFDSSKATPIAVEPESNITGINFSALRPATFKLSGRVENINQQAGQYTIVSVSHPGKDFRMEPFWVADVNPSDGSFEISGVYPGTYELSARSGRATGKSSVVVDRNIENIRVTIPPTVSLKGRLETRERAGSIAPVGPVGLSFDPTLDVLPIPIRIEADGPFTIPDTPQGTFHVRAYAPEGYTVDIHQGSRDVSLDGALTFEANAEPLELVARPAEYGAIQGLITGPPNVRTGTLGYQILLIPDEPRRANTSSYVEMNVAARGNFQYQSVLPGNYKLLAWDSNRPLGISPFMDSVSLQKFEKYAVAVRVRPNERLEVTVPAIP